MALPTIANHPDIAPESQTAPAPVPVPTAGQEEEVASANVPRDLQDAAEVIGRLEAALQQSLAELQSVRAQLARTSELFRKKKKNFKLRARLDNSRIRVLNRPVRRRKKGKKEKGKEGDDWPASESEDSEESLERLLERKANLEAQLAELTKGDQPPPPLQRLPGLRPPPGSPAPPPPPPPPSRPPGSSRSVASERAAPS